MAKTKDEISDPAAVGAAPDGSPAAPAVDVVPAEIVSDSLAAYARARAARIMSGDSGALPVILGLVVIRGNAGRSPSPARSWSTSM